ncbi:MAG: hypothetical protein ACRYG7_15030 [Janthinobacterium lividum]
MLYCPHALDRLFLLRLYRRLGALSIVPTFAITVVGWVLFRAETLTDALAYVRRMLGYVPTPPADAWPGAPFVAPQLIAPNWQQFGPQFWWLLGLGAVFAFMNVLPGLERRLLGLYAAHTLSLRRAVALGVAAALLLVLSASSIISSSFNPFIYFRF